MSYRRLELRHIWRELILTAKYGIFTFKKNVPRQFHISMIDGKCYQGGMCDRFNNIISLYAFCKQRDLEFKIFYVSPFPLLNYLIPNKYNWVIDSDELTFNLFESRFLYTVGEYKARRLLSIKTDKQIHFYGNRNLLELLNSEGNTDYKWGTLFKELFKPVPKVEKQIQLLREMIGGEYISAVFRFQQLLGDFAEYKFPTLKTVKEKNELIDKCASALLELQKRNEGRRILVASDSVTFLEYVSNIKGVYIIPGRVVHIDVTKGENYEVYMKSFLDFFMISESIKVYGMGTEQMYSSSFPMYAAKVNDIPFERVII